MKKITLFISALALSCTMFGQSQRLCLAEEFTQASCPPCAAANPYFNPLMAANTTKAVTIKYQTSWPGVDPMNAQNMTDVQTRVTYYNVTGVPDGKLDGTDFYPGTITQATIDAEYAVPSPFTINISHTFNATVDSVFITCVITASQSFTAASASSLKAQVAMIEKDITFATEPGTNGETDFPHVMRKMYPDANGTSLPMTWTNGQTQTLTFAEAIPAYIYGKSQIAIVAFVQDGAAATGNVKQAGYSAPIPLPLDAGATALVVPAIQCTTTFTPTVTITNFGATTLTSCTINYKIDNGTVMTQSWTGTLANGATTTVTLPLQTTTVGGHTFTSYTTAPNGGTDFDNTNNQTVKTFAIMAAPTSTPLVEGFVAPAFPPTNWVVVSHSTYPWVRATSAGGFGTSSTCAEANFFADGSGNVEDMYVKATNLTTTLAHSGMTFDVAYAKYATNPAFYPDQLDVEVSTDCGATWTNVYSKTGNALSTAPVDSAGSFTPSASQWRKENVDLTAYNNQINVLIRFRATSGYGNNLYVDNINIFSSASMVGVNDITSTTINSLEVYPNPINDNATVDFNLANAANVEVTMNNLLGQTVYSSSLGQLSNGNHTMKIDASKLNAGIYFITLNVADGKITKKVSINK